MPYTQANPIDESVRKALKRKERLLSDRAATGGDAALYYFTNRTPWIRLTSAVDVVGNAQQQQLNVSEASQLARDYVLTSAYEQGDLPAGHTLSDQLGIRPRPGIQNMHITAHNQFGSLRTAKVTFQVWSKEDLDACEVLYMRPGMSVLLEWGWSLYLSGEEDNLTVHPMGKGYDIFNSTKSTLIDVLDELNEKKVEYGHGYDAIFGFVKNFSWTLRPDGGYDCSTDVVSPGEIIESLNIAQPVSDVDAAFYNKYKQSLLDERSAEISKQLGDPNLNDSSWQKFVDRWLVPIINGAAPTGGGVGWENGAPVSATSIASRAKEEVRASLIEELHSNIKEVPSYESQTALATFFEVDINLVALADIEAKLEKRSKNSSYVQPALVDFDLSTLQEGNRYTSRLFGTNGDLLENYKWLRYIKWKTQQYKKNTEGELVIENGVAVIEEQTHPEAYIKYGLVLELMNRFMFHNGGKPIITFDASKSMVYNDRAADLFSLDPSSCILPSDMQFLESDYDVYEITHDTEFVFPPTSTKTPSTSTVTDIYLNLNMITSLITSSNIKRFTDDGIAQIRLFEFIQAINDKINQACGGALELSIQYYEDEGKFAIVDRVNFDSIDREEFNYKLTAIGTKSVCKDISVASSLTPEMASSLAISVQTGFKAQNNTEAGFLRFNDGLADRILSDRTTTGTFSNTAPKDPYTSDGVTSAELSQVEELYNYVYGSLRWMPHSFNYAREIHHKYVTEVLNKASGEIPINGRVVVPFVTNITLDGTSGVKILNSLLLSENLLPYSYNQIKGGVGALITGVEATVDAGGWWTVLKAQYYARKSGNLQDVKASIKKAVEEKEDPGDHILYKYAEEAAQQDLTIYQNNSGIIRNIQQSVGLTIPPIVQNLRPFVEQHQQKYWIAQNTFKNVIKQGELIPETLEYVLATAGEIPESPIKLYWTNINPAYKYDLNTHKIAWSSVYVSYIMTNFNSNVPKGAFSPKAAHYLYTAKGLQALKNQESSKWVAFSLLDHGNLIQAEVGDIIVWPTSTSLVDATTGLKAGSHGVIVIDVDLAKKQVTTAGGNESIPGSGSPVGLYNIIDRKLKIETLTITNSKGNLETVPVYGLSEKGVRKRTMVLKYINKRK